MASLEDAVCAARRGDYVALRSWSRCGDLRALRALRSHHERGGPWHGALYACAAENGNLACLRYLHEHGCPWDTWGPRECSDAVENAWGTWGHLACGGAAENGHLACLRYLHEHGFPWNDAIARVAAQNGHLECLRYVHEHGCLLKSTATLATRYGHLECLRYAHEHGCPWDEHTCEWACGHACRSAEWECLRYAIAHGCPHVKEDVRDVVRHYLLPKWRAHVRVVRPIALYWLGRAMVNACAPEGAARKRDREAFEADFGA